MQSETIRFLSRAASVLMLLAGFFNWHVARVNADIGKYEIINNSKLTSMAVAQAEAVSEAALSVSFNDILAQTSTPLLSNIPNRTHNIILSCKLINGAVILPGAIFSFNQAVGIRTEDRGFKPAPTFINGQVAESAGGGICQLASTLYNACLLSNLEIVSRTNHSMFADYFDKPGFDAAVSWGTIDYCFKNNTNNPIKIYAWVEDTVLFVEITGTKMDDYTVDIESRIISITPYETIYKKNIDLPQGQTKVIQEPHTGYVVETYRVLKDASGNIVNRTLEARSIYNKTDEIIEHNSMS